LVSVGYSVEVRLSMGPVETGKRKGTY
jgi:hypothetical protein